ncbi:MAG: uroporphyrinogen-III synthase [Alphaproteobacteria bacterium]|nr:uroporphyrinogen-III synthase [Alphaproteobacteria bacterium]
MRVLITRPESDSAALAAELGARGHQTLLQPLLVIVPTGAAVDLAGVQAILATSANGIRALAAATAERRVPLYAVGDTSAATARASGFTDVASAAGDVAALVAVVAAALRPEDGRLLHVAGADIAGDLQAMLRAKGFTVDRVVLYRAIPAAALEPAIGDALKAARIDAVLFFSPRTARTFAKLASVAGIVPALGATAAICLSRAVAAEIEALRWRTVKIADRPDRAALIAALSTLAGEGR